MSGPKGAAAYGWGRPQPRGPAEMRGCVRDQRPVIGGVRHVGCPHAAKREPSLACKQGSYSQSLGMLSEWAGVGRGFGTHDVVSRFVKRRSVSSTFAGLKKFCSLACGGSQSAGRNFQPPLDRGIQARA